MKHDARSAAAAIEAEAGDRFSSRLPGFYKLPMAERVALVGRLRELGDDELAALGSADALDREVADGMVENAIGVFGLPLGLGLNFQINGTDHLVPMAVEEPSVVAAVSFAAKIVREAGGFTASADLPLMIGQVQVVGCADPERARDELVLATGEILARANSFHPQLERRGGGARGIEVRILPDPAGGAPTLVLHLLVDTRDAMGANIVNTMAEGVAPLVEHLARARVYLRILSNLTDRRLARARCAIPVAALADFGRTGREIAEGIVQASRFAEVDPYRAATHNKGIMNGVDAVALATGNDWRALEAGAHAYAARDGHYRPLSVWRLEGDVVTGSLEMPMAVGTVGGPIRVHPMARLGLRLLGVHDARGLATVMAAVGLAQNLAAIRALGSVGIQRGHMALHARVVAASAGARGEWVERIATQMIDAGQVRLETAQALLATARAQGQVTPISERPPPRPSFRPSANANSGFMVYSRDEAAGLERDESPRFRFRVPAHWRSPVACNPHAAAAEAAVHAWFASLGCTPAELARVRKFDAAGYVGIPFPELSPELTVRVGKYLSMWLLWDDVQVENQADRWRITAAALRAGVWPAGMTRFDEGWWQLFEELAARRSARWLEDLCDAMALWNDAAVHEAQAFEAHRARGVVPDFAVQLEMRTATIGMYATVHLLEDQYDHELPRAFHRDPTVRRLKKLANKIVGLGNDVFSFGKDYAEKQINLISTWMFETGLPGDAALEQLIRLHDAALEEFDRLAEGLGSWGPEADPYIQRWLRDVRYASLGFSIWESRAPRYTAHKLVVNGRVVEPSFAFVAPAAEPSIYKVTT